MSSESLDEIYPEVYDELRRLASRYLGSERPDHTLQPTALVHEAYLRLQRQDKERWSERREFYAVAALSMRRILVNHARDRARLRRGGGRPRLSLDESEIPLGERALDLVALEEALERLELEDARAARIVTLRYFGGLSSTEVAELLEVSLPTVKRAWTTARAWLHRELTRGETNA